jgi:hypothetical protein
MRKKTTTKKKEKRHSTMHADPCLPWCNNNATKMTKVRNAIIIVCGGNMTI